MGFLLDWTWFLLHHNKFWNYFPWTYLFNGSVCEKFKGVYAYVEKKRWSLLILLLSVAFIQRKWLNTPHEDLFSVLLKIEEPMAISAIILRIFWILFRAFFLKLIIWTVLNIYNTVILVGSVKKFLERNFLFIKKVQAFLDLILWYRDIEKILVQKLYSTLCQNNSVLGNFMKRLCNF